MNGLLKIDKDADYTSHDIDNMVKKRFNLPKVGHLGTLDPFATGLLVVGIMEGTKALNLLDDSVKEYQASLQLFEETDSLDITGNVTRKEPPHFISLESVQAALKKMTSLTSQIPPAFSAKHIDGVRAYTLARNGQAVSLPPKTVRIEKCDLLSYDPEKGIIDFVCTVSRGTYIRSIGRDIAYELNTFGYLRSLRRTKVGSLDLNGAVRIKDLQEANVISMEDLCCNVPVYQLEERDYSVVYNGHQITVKDHNSDFLFMKYKNDIIAIYKKSADGYICYKGFRHEQN